MRTPAQPPTSRPTWVLIMASVMFMAGGYSLVAGLLKLRDPSIVLTVGNTDPAGTDEQLNLSRRLSAARAAAVAPHQRSVRAEALGEVALALFTLYATVAVILRDRNGRALAIGVGILGIVYQLATLPVYVSLMRDYAEQAAGLLAMVIIQAAPGGGTAPDPDQVTTRLRAAIVGGPVVVTMVSIVGSLVLLTFFAGRRGRLLYGIIDLPVGPKRDI